ncbi:up-regulator of cell proliferation-like [Betta splendens]|uniref:Up-regulator of cell proliferation-like n=1 Tax=Betta splendens TaxID=158456 RepID=A0A6P7LJB6_BETSP|nr:up-regulator of cell proliferation-like [Betta splendens]XP_040925033.1 up-regulator of cell proliferation-like [Betta splendens]XP_040925035.1 up-regulator of cell proliferation-like [Betta splendens]XP_055361618.1 up-regulator of cell proliferation-like [Betta splendens]XP_055361619.1 up-regulator of cell proliferation-like [Betta splendens]XP_055361620.1 up-regulator of cell proliferation-like [Betta splendens]
MNTGRQKLSDPEKFLSSLGLKTFFSKKLTLHSLLEINKGSVHEEEVDSLDKIPQHFLRKLFKLSAECRSCVQLTNNNHNEVLNDLNSTDILITDDSTDSAINPLDLIVALFLCADSFLQQEMASKMSMCQFSVPLLLPPHDSHSACSLMLWALRDIVREWRPHTLSESRGFVQGSLVQAKLPFCSFVRLRNCSLSKSQLLNQVLSFGQYNNNIFMHRDMKGGTNHRTIANGLVEVCWFLPSGTKNLDIFPEPVAFANMRGDVGESLNQFRFLLEVSTATFVFLDKVEEDEHKVLTSLQNMKSKLFLIVNRSKGTTKQDIMSVKMMIKEMELPNSRLKAKDPKENIAEFSEKLCVFIRRSLTNKVNTVSIENMQDKARRHGLSVDEKRSKKQNKAAEMIVREVPVQRIPNYKKDQLPLQGAKWKTLSQLEMEECRLKKPGNLELEEYKTLLQSQKLQIKEDLGKHKQQDAMKEFIKHVSTTDPEKRDFFLKWMKIHLNAHVQSDTQLSLLHRKIKEQSSKEKKDENLLAELYQELLDSSLGIEHYMREMGLIYEFSTNRTSEEICRLPGVAADMLLDGHPLELLDGDASNIPETWVTDVLMELHNRVGGMSRLLVLTVLGVQSTGKSTLLNTMFGVQFPVSSGRCTRGAYMIFLRIGDDVKSDLNCDFIVLIDTEGLRSPLMAHREDSFEHDNQLATFVIGLSDVTIINIAMENLAEMKDILHIATHAFLRMKIMGKKPVCHFVHQNVAGVSAHAKTVTERKQLLDQLNEIAQVAAEMENLPDIKAFTDVLDYDVNKNNWNIPGLWHGTPPMAPVNTGYSEAVAELKKHLLQTLSCYKDRAISQIPEFVLWTKSLWKSVKYENFLFNFRNTLVAHAYDKICQEFHQWEWEFRRKIYYSQKTAQLKILNAKAEFNLQHLKDLVETKKSEVSEKITVQEKIMKQKLQDYYRSKNIHIDLIREYKIHFYNLIKSIAKEIRLLHSNNLDEALELKKCSKEFQEKMEKYREVIKEQANKLVREQPSLSDDQLKEEFEKMWTKETEKMMEMMRLKEQNICENIIKVFKGSFVNRKVESFCENIGNLKEQGKDEFHVSTEHEGHTNCLSSVFCLRDSSLQRTANDVIKSAEQMLDDIAKTNTDYHESLTKDLLDKVDESLKNCKKRYSIEFEFDLKLHICGIASRKFMDMHRKYLSDNIPQNLLKKFKRQYLTDFHYLYKLRSTDKRDY